MIIIQESFSVNSCCGFPYQLSSELQLNFFIFIFPRLFKHGNNVIDKLAINSKFQSRYIVQSAIENYNAFLVHFWTIYYVLDFSQHASRFKITIVSLIFLYFYWLVHVVDPVIGDVTRSEYFGAKRRVIDRVIESESQ